MLFGLSVSYSDLNCTYRSSPLFSVKQWNVTSSVAVGGYSYELLTEAIFLPNMNKTLQLKCNDCDCSIASGVSSFSQYLLLVLFSIVVILVLLGFFSLMQLLARMAVKSKYS